MLLTVKGHLAELATVVPDKHEFAPQNTHPFRLSRTDRDSQFARRRRQTKLKVPAPASVLINRSARPRLHIGADEVR